METLSKLMGRFYIILLYLSLMSVGAILTGLIGDIVFHSKAQGLIYLGGAIGYMLARPIRNRIAARYGIKSTQQQDKESKARELFNEGCELGIKGKNIEAIEKYKEVVSKFPDLPQAADAKKAIEFTQSQVVPPQNTGEIVR